MKSLPARLTKEQVAVCLGCQPYHIPVLVRARLLKVLGTPNHQCVKFFGAVDIEAKAQDLNWLGKATDAIYQNRRKKNDSVKGGGR